MGDVIARIAIPDAAAVKAILVAADPLALAAVIARGYPVRQPRRLRREPVSSFVTVDPIDGAAFEVSGRAGTWHEISHG